MAQSNNNNNSSNNNNNNNNLNNLDITKGPLDECNVFVKYLPPEVDDKEFHRMFKNYGNIVSCKIMVDQTSGKSLGYGFVRYSAPSAAQKCIDAMNGLRVSNKRLLCKLANQSSSTTYNAEYGKNPVLTAQVQSDNLYIKPLLPNTTEDDLRGIFGKFGRIIDCKVMIDRMTGLSRQIGFVRFETPQQAQTVIDEMNGFRLSPGAPPLIIKFADTKEQKEARQAMRGRGRGSHHHGMHHGAGNGSPIPPMYYYYPQYGAAAFGYQGYPAFASNPAAAAAAAAAGYNANAYPYAAMASALGYGAYPGVNGGQPGQPGALPNDFTGLQPPSPLQGDPTDPRNHKAGADPADTAFASSAAARFERQQVQFTANAANVSLSNIN
jgi:RNA recognition motif-containing protein